MLDVVIPVYNEQVGLEACIRRLHEYLRTEVPYSSRITIADNASTDGTLFVARRLKTELDNVEVVHLDDKGRGRALQAAWKQSQAHVVAYMDVDLSTGLDALMPLVAPLISGHSDVAIGTRLSRTSRVVRGPKREFISRGYNLLLHTALRARFSDAQCGFKAVRTDVVRELLPLIEDGEWFFDTELLIIAERAGLRIHEVPVDWIDDPDSRVDLADTIKKDLKGVWRLSRALLTGRLPITKLRTSLGREPLVAGVPDGMPGQAVRFAAVGVISTIAFALGYLALQPLFGAQVANFLSLFGTAIFNTAANRAFTFRVRGTARLARHHLHGLGLFLFGLAITSGALFVLHTAMPDATRAIELTVLVVANLIATLTRFVGLRWVFAGGAK